MSERQQTKHHASPVANTPSNDSQQQLLVLDVFGAEELLSKTGQRKATDDCLDDDVLPPPRRRRKRARNVEDVAMVTFAVKQTK